MADWPLDDGRPQPIAMCFCVFTLQIQQRYSIPTNSQRFIVGRVWPKDSDVLSQCGLLMDNAELFVYVMSNTAVTSTAANGKLSHNNR